MTNEENERQREYKRTWYNRTVGKVPPKEKKPSPQMLPKSAKPPRLSPEERYSRIPRIYGRFGHNHHWTKSRLRKIGIASDSEQALIIESIETLKFCPICTQEPNKTTPLVMDHNHQTNSFRGVICSNCNKGLGLFFDNSNALRAAADYIDCVGVFAKL